MNCKPCDIARIVHPTMYGKLVLVLYAEPIGHHTLPDGHGAVNQTGEVGWVFEFLGAPQEVPLNYGTRLARYAACGDKWLRPIRDNDGEDETLRWAGKPQKEAA